MLLTMKEEGIPTVVWMDPILPFINDTKENLSGILSYCETAKVRGIICFGMGLTLREGNREYFYEQLDKLSMDMVYGVDPSDREGYLKLWQDFILKWNELLPEIPLYSNVYYTIYPEWLNDFVESSLWEFSQAIVYASIEGAEG